MRRIYAKVMSLHLTEMQADKLNEIKRVTGCKSTPDTIRMLIETAEVTPVISYTYAVKVDATPDLSLKSHERAVLDWLSENEPATAREIALGVGRKISFVLRVIKRYGDVFSVSDAKRNVKGYPIPMYQVRRGEA